MLVSNCLDRLEVGEGDALLAPQPGDLLIPLRQLEYRQKDQRIQVRSNGKGHFETLIEGVADFTLSFGVAADSQAAAVAGTYRNVIGGAEAARIRSVRVALLLSEQPSAKTQEGLQQQRYVQVTSVRNRLD